ncbi:MAG: arginine--tRNA ligase [Planctomycetota bacterium]
MQEFREAIVDVAAKAGLDPELVRQSITIPKERGRADLTLPCFRFGKPPTEPAQKVANAFVASEWLEACEATGPFVNFRFNRATFADRVLATADETAGKSDEGAGQTVVIDYGSPNIAKPLLFHHLRSSAIGQTLCNLFRWRGYTVVGLNFLGDVGTAFGKLMVGIEEWGEPTSIASFSKLYVDASKGCADKPEWMERAREWAKRLEDDDAEAVKHWEKARELSLQGFAGVYDWLGIRHDVIDGEKMYVQRARALVDELLASGKAEESDGGVVIETGQKIPFLIRKTDGATLYGTRDIVAAADRFDRYEFARMLYVVDVAQELHFRQLFAALSKLGYDWVDRCKHVRFGQVLFEGSRTRTREGGSVSLEDVLREGQRRALKIIEEKKADLPDKEAVAKSVGTAAVLFADVGFPSTKNINFVWDEILSFDGRTGPYLQYVHASACSILRKGVEAGATDIASGDPALLADEHEWDLLRRLAEFPTSVKRACDDCEPSHVSNFLYELAREFRAYYTAGGRDASLRVLVDDAQMRAARLRLVDAVRNSLAVGLGLLGIDAVERM